MGLVQRIMRPQVAQEEFAFRTLRSLSLVGGLIALCLVPVRPEHTRHLVPLFVVFALYKALLFAFVRLWPERVRTIFICTVYIDLAFVFVFIWFTGGLDSQFYHLFYLLIALDSYNFGFRVGLSASIAAGAFYIGADLLSPSLHPHPGHLPSQVSLMVFLGTALGLLSERERRARQRAEMLNVELAGRQASLERAYQNLRNTQERLLHSERLATVGKLAAKVAHEIRNPLSSISLNLDLVEDEIAASAVSAADETMSLLTSIRTEVERLAEIADNYLRLARLPEPRRATESVKEVLESLCDLLRGELAERQVEVKLHIEPNLPPVLVDENQLKQVLLNILRNAFEAMPSGGLVTVAARVADGGVEIVIADEGQGISPENLDRIFEPFFTTKAYGTGLGLAVAKQIVQAHDGSVTCSSQPGRGTVLTVRIPISGGGESRGMA